MKPVLLHFKEREFNQHLNNYQPALDSLNAILKTYQKFNLKSLNVDEFKNLINNPFEVLFDIITEGKPFQIGGLELDKRQALSLIKKPKNYDEFESLIIDFRNKQYHAHVFNNISILDNEIELTGAFLEKEKKMFEIWATTDKALKANEFVEKVVTAANECFGENKVNIAQVVDELIGFHIHVHGNPIQGVPDKYNTVIYHEKIRGFMQNSSIDFN